MRLTVIIYFKTCCNRAQTGNIYNINKLDFFHTTNDVINCYYIIIQF